MFISSYVCDWLLLLYDFWESSRVKIHSFEFCPHLLLSLSLNCMVNIHRIVHPPVGGGVGINKFNKLPLLILKKFEKCLNFFSLKAAIS